MARLAHPCIRRSAGTYTFNNFVLDFVSTEYAVLYADLAFKTPPLPPLPPKEALGQPAEGNASRIAVRLRP